MIHLRPLIICVLLVAWVEFREEFPVLVWGFLVLALDNNYQVTLDGLPQKVRVLV